MYSKCWLSEGLDTAEAEVHTTKSQKNIHQSLSLESLRQSKQYLETLFILQQQKHAASQISGPA